MKIIHTADIHLGSRMNSSFPKEISDMRKQELRNTFRRMVDYAKAEDVCAILLAGDVFDSDEPFKKDRDFFYSVVRKNPSIDFYYLRGNHDTEGAADDDPPENLHTFSDRWRSYDLGGGVVLSGLEITDENSLSLYSTLDLESDRLNIVMLHGQAAETFGRDKINVKRLREKNIDYLALGHIHKPTPVPVPIDGRGVYAYSGCPEGRGFDECGERGFYLLETGRSITAVFVPFAERTIVETDVDVSDAEDAYSAYRKIESAVSFNTKDIYSINLTGTRKFDAEKLEEDVEAYLSSGRYMVRVRDRRVVKIDIGEYLTDTSLKGEFVRTVMECGEYTEEEKAEILSVGFKALEGGQIE